MYRIDVCPCCRQRMQATCPALAAPFVMERVRREPAAPCTLMTCPACGFRGFDQRFDEEELGRLYRDYRGEAYFQARHRWEPWYTRKANQALGDDPEELRSRKGNALGLVTPCLGGAVPARILDFGGDRGQFIPDEWTGDRFVYEVSGQAPLPGIQALTSFAGQEASFDLVMLCMVMEHLSEPAAQLEVLHGLVAPGGLLYVEVPLERPGLRWAGAWPWGFRGLRWLAGHPWLLRLMDLHSTYFRVRKGFIPPGGFLKAHEHINFFTRTSLEALLGRMGFQVMACEEMGFAGALGQATAIGCVARKAG